VFTEAEVAVFLDELDEKIEVISEQLLVLEKDRGNRAALQEIFRAAHTIKGSSAIMGYEKMSALTHEMENLLDRLRHGELEVSTEIVDCLFRALDTLKTLRARVTAGGEEPDVEPVVAWLRSCGTCPSSAQGPGAASPEGACPAAPAAAAGARGGVPAGPPVEPPPPLDDVELSVVREAEGRGFRAHWVTVHIDPECQMKSVRAFLIFENLGRTGEIIKSLPPAEEIQEGRYDWGFRVLLLTKEEPRALEHLLMSIAEVTAAEVTPVVLPEDYRAPVRAEAAPGAAPAARVQDLPEARRVSQTVRIDVQKLDTLMNLVGELVIDRTRLNRLVEVFGGRYGTDDLVETLNEISSHLGQITGDLQEHIMKARMLPVAQVFNRFPRMVRDLAHRLGKEIDFIVQGKETELDRNVIEVIADPLMHLIRNAVDHGIEPPEERVRLGKPRAGRLLLKASYQESFIVITVEDDGRGMDPARIRERAVEMGLLDREAAARLPEREVLDLVFLPGFSTAGAVSELSGRGVGLDVVRNQIEQVNGTVEMFTAVGAGTRFTIKLPLTLAIIRALMVTLGDQVYAFPLTNVVETMHVRPSEIRRIKNNEVVVVRGQVLPLVRLAHLFQVPDAGGEHLFAVVVGSGERRVGIIVDRLLGEQEIVIKSLGEYLGRIPGLAGATILGDGRVALIVDVRGLVKEIGTEEVAYAAG
jgi:two-component system chemotaxis sensor kinase CheA